jgi:hypothetical protein
MTQPATNRFLSVDLNFWISDQRIQHFVLQSHPFPNWAVGDRLGNGDLVANLTSRSVKDFA